MAEAKTDAKQDDHGHGGEHGNNTVTVTIDTKEKEIHRGSYTTEKLKEALGVDAARDLDVIENGEFRHLKPGEHTVVKEGMEFVSRQPGGGAS